MSKSIIDATGMLTFSATYEVFESGYASEGLNYALKQYIVTACDDDGYVWAMRIGEDKLITDDDGISYVTVDEKAERFSRVLADRLNGTALLELNSDLWEFHRYVYGSKAHFQNQF